MKVLLTGATGQVGHELKRSLQAIGEVVALDRAQLDLSDLQQVRETVRALRPNLIVNPAAYTAVDRAETEPDLARAVNAHAPAVLAEEAKRLGAALVHYSTDYVFDGTKTSPYTELDKPNPANVYGQTKLEGELAVAAAGIPHLILRTSWVYGMMGRNFLLTMLKLGRERAELKVVDDQHGAPTWSRTISDTTAILLALAKREGWWDNNSGIYHLSSGGATTWHGFAQAILANAGLDCRVLPIPTAEYPLPARRPANSLLNSEKLTGQFVALPDWETALDLCMN
jgi:dTDP-4-dehydrorhamnose reductase